MTPLPIVHVVATDQRRGAEVFAADLVRALKGRTENRVVVLRPGPSVAVDYDSPTTGLCLAPGLAGTVRGLPAIRRALAGPEDTVVCAHGGDAVRAVVLAGAPRVAYRRIGLAPAAGRRGARRVFERTLMTRSTLVLCVAEAVRREALDVFGVAPALVRTVPNGVDPERVAGPGRDASRRALGLPLDARVVVSLGSLSWEKDPLRALTISAVAARKVDRLVHLVVGDGPLAAQVDEVASASAGRVVRLPPLADVGTVLDASDVLLLASRPDGMEGMPAVVIEAAMAGVPVVANQVAGVEEVVVDGETGVLVPPGHDGAAAIALADLLGDDERRARTGEAAADRCLANFAIGPIADAYVQAFEEAAVVST